MQSRITKSPITINRLGLGTYALANASQVVYEAIRKGYRHFDCAGIYRNEAEVGAGITQAIDEEIVSREDLFITSKVWNSYHAKELVKQACENSLQDLGVEYLDLYLIHWPLSTSFVPFESLKTFQDLASPLDPNRLVPLSETWSAMEELVDEGKVRHIGVSNFEVQLLRDLLTYCRIKPVCNQVECHVYLSQKRLISYCAKENILVTAYCPLARGSAYKKKSPIALLEPAVITCANSHKKTSAQVLLRWLIQSSSNVVVIPKTATRERLDENLGVWDFELSPKEMETIDNLNRNMRLIEYPGEEVFSY